MHQLRTSCDIFAKNKVCVINTLARRSVHWWHICHKARITILYYDEIMNHDYLGCSRSTEKRHRPSRGRSSRSRSCSRSGSQTRNAHSIEIDRYNIDDIDVLRTSHSISRSRSVAAISNDTDPDGKMTSWWSFESSCHTET